MPATPSCPAEVRATKSCLGDWRVTHADFEHVNYAGGDARERLCGIDPLVKSTVSANSDIGAKVQKSLEQQTG